MALPWLFKRCANVRPGLEAAHPRDINVPRNAIHRCGETVIPASSRDPILRPAGNRCPLVAGRLPGTQGLFKPTRQTREHTSKSECSVVMFERKRLAYARLFRRTDPASAGFLDLPTDAPRLARQRCFRHIRWMSFVSPSGRLPEITNGGFVDAKNKEAGAERRTALEKPEGPVWVDSSLLLTAA